MTIYHNHHIIPKHMGGTDDPSNIVRLTIEEHAEAHRILFEQYGRWQDKMAYEGLSGMIGKDEIIKESRKRSGLKRRGQTLSFETKQKISINHSRHMSGKHHSIETRQQMSDSGKIKIFTEDHRKHLSEKGKQLWKSENSPWKNHSIKMKEAHARKRALGISWKSS